MSHEVAIEKVFVYGTLRRGASNYHRLVDSRWCGRATLRGRLYRVSWYPGLVPDEGAEPILGDLLEVKADMLPALDAFEGLPPGSLCGPEYERRRLEIDLLKGGRTEAWVWVWRAPTDHLVEVPSGDWLEVERSF
jgi:gamma-glutamylcyclotransferase (GGCT)/AIG2-like uncharacterized protein YtfP